LFLFTFSSFLSIGCSRSDAPIKCTITFIQVEQVPVVHEVNFFILTLNAGVVSFALQVLYSRGEVPEPIEQEAV
jgi:hypothetical protein